MNKLVITEISRIQGLIGKPLIMEGWGDIAKEGLELITKKLGKQSVAIEDLLLKLSKATSEVQIRNILSKLVDSSKEIADILIPKILSTLTDLERKSILDFKSELIKKIKVGEIKSYDIPKIIDGYVKDKLSNNMEAIKSHIRKDISDSADKAIKQYNNLSYTQSFVQGYKTSQAPTLFLKKLGRNIPIPYLGQYLRNRIQKLSPEESKKVYAWFFLGVGDANLISSIFKKHGIAKAAVNLTGQIVSKWVFWSTAFSLTNLLIDVVTDLDEEVYESDFEAIKDRVLKNYEFAGVNWLFPITVVYQQLIGPLFRGGIIKFQKEQLIEKLENIKNKSKVEMDKIDTGKDKVETIITGINDSEPGFRLWCERNEKEFAGYNVDGDGLGRTKKNDVITTWSWNKDTKTFDEY